jgi:3-isopropylmalate/(R)-2-methylmalate dehydratase large subunit
MTSAPQTLFAKLWDRHVVADAGDRDLLFVDLHLIFEGTSKEAFAGLDDDGLPVRRPDLTLGTVDHFSPTNGVAREQVGSETALYLDLFDSNCRRHGIRYFGYQHAQQGIVHVMAPELGLTLPGMSVVCGDSHTSTHGALGALAFGIGSTQVRQVLAAQALLVARPRAMRIVVDGELAPGVSSKDLALALIGELGNLAAVGCALELTGTAVRSMSVESRMTLCNMGVELGASMTMIAPDETVVEFLRDRPAAPSGTAWEEAVRDWRELRSDEGAVFDQDLHFDARTARPFVTWGTSPAHAVAIDAVVPDPGELATREQVDSAWKALTYMDLEPGRPMRSIGIDAVFIGSCANSRIEDLRAAASVLEGRHLAIGVRGFVVPGSAAVRRQAEAEGLAAVFEGAGMEWREPGCSFCVAVNGDTFAPGTRTVSTSNRNFEGRQGALVRTHLASPAVAAASGVAGRICAPDDLEVVA